jgi:hypothetical protein
VRNARACHNCGLPESTLDSEGREITITTKPENGFQKEHKTAAWCCSDECAYQALAVAKYGPVCHKWPVTLAEFRSLTSLDKASRPSDSQKRCRPSKLARLSVWNQGVSVANSGL